MSDRFYRIVLRAFLAAMLAMVVWLAVSDMRLRPGSKLSIGHLDAPGIYLGFRSSMVLLFVVGIIAVAVLFVLIAAYRTFQEMRQKRKQD